MVYLYNNKFVTHQDIRTRYYDKILANVKSGKCPICGIGQASTLDHYLAKTLYPTYSVTPDNLIPACKDCNSNKGNSPVNSKLSAPLHPYFDDVDNVIWLCADVVPKNNILVAQYYVNPEIEEVNVELYSRLCAHLDLYKLKHAYSVQASTEISENIGIWKKVYQLSGKQRLLQYLTECLQSYETAQKNTWKTALLRGIYNAVKDDIINEFLMLLRCNAMAASYKKLFKLLIDRDMKKKELAEKAGISIATITKMGKDGAVVSSEVLVKICSALGCTMDDIVEIIEK